MTSELNPAAKKYFGDVAKEYDERRNAKLITTADDVIINEFLDGCEKGSVVLDLPAGTGRAVSAVLDRELQYIGADISEDMLSFCKEKIGGRLGARTIVVDARSTGLPDRSVDYLMSIKFIKWLPNDNDVLNTLREFRRVCRKRCIINVKVKDNAGLLRRLSGVLRGPSPEPRARTVAEGTFAELSRKAGWSVRAVRENPESQGRVKFFVLE